MAEQPQKLVWPRSVLVLTLAVAASAGCGDGMATRSPDRLSEAGIFVDPLAANEPARGVVRYEINSPLFSDSAEKLRFLELPAGEPAIYRNEGVFEFPVGTRLVKTFFYPVDARTATGPRRLIETRILTHEPSGWSGAAYVWNPEQTEAHRRVAGSRVPVEWTDHEGVRQSLEYRVPSEAECGLCHRTDGRSLQPIATRAAQLNRSIADDGLANQLVIWSDRGWLEGLPDLELIPHLPVWDDETSGTVEDRARAYLDANCAHCHSPEGPASGSGLDLRYAQREPLRVGIFKRPRAAGQGSGELLYDIWPGRPEASILLRRMESNEPGVMMPELGRMTAHREASALIRAWIAAMEGGDPPDRM